MYWFDWLSIGAFVLGALILGGLRGSSRRTRSSAANGNVTWVVMFLLLLAAFMAIIATGVLSHP